VLFFSYHVTDERFTLKSSHGKANIWGEFCVSRETDTNRSVGTLRARFRTLLFLLLARYVPNVAKRSVWDQCNRKYILRTDDRPTNLLFGKISNGHISQGVIDPLHVWFYGGIFGVGGSNGAISGLTKFNRYVGENNSRGVMIDHNLKYFLLNTSQHRYCRHWRPQSTLGVKNISQCIFLSISSFRCRRPLFLKLSHWRTRAWNWQCQYATIAVASIAVPRELLVWKLLHHRKRHRIGRQSTRTVRRIATVFGWTPL